MIKMAIRMLVMAALAAPTLAGTPAARAADQPAGTAADTAEVLGKLHASNQKEIEMGKLAQKNGQSKDVKTFGTMLVKDHTDADKKVSALAKKENVNLDAATPTVAGNMEHIPAGAGFDASFAKSMLDDHKRDVAETKEVLGKTSDNDLKNLLGSLLPTLEKHEETAQKIVSSTGQ
jgi:putative membrane protein